jgi:hypothetical protein
MQFGPAIATTKETLGVVREIVVIVVVLAIVFSPGVFVRWAKFFNEESRKAGATTEFSLGPLKLAFSNAAEQVSNLAAANDEVKKLSEQLAHDPNSEQLRRTADALGSRLQASIASAKTALLAQDQAIQDASGVTEGGGSYGIVVSADKSEEQTEYEVKALRKRDLTNIGIYNRQNFLRTVARFENKENADQQLPRLQQYRKSAYVINLDKWCGDARESGKTIGGAPVFLCP